MLPLPFGCGLLAADPATGPREVGDSNPGRDDGWTGEPGLSASANRTNHRVQRLFHDVATGPSSRRRRWTPVGLAVFAASLALILLGGRATDQVVGAPPLPGGPWWSAAGWALVLLGLGLCGWCVSLFSRFGGTPVPLSPPGGLVQRGPYAWVRNPMLGGVFAALFGTGIILRSPSTVLVWVPVYVLVHVLELRWVEEPELERRFGVAYRAYRDAAPMFIPRLWRRR